MTDKWKNRSVEKPNDFALLTAEICRATFGMTPSVF
jgi:hypothetical protein